MSTQTDPPLPPAKPPRDLVTIARQTARYGLLKFNGAIASARILPSFLIVGAPRCGTTSMFTALSRHPAIASPPPPWSCEVHYFDINYHRGLAWYRGHFPLTVRARRAAHAAGVEPMAFESTPYYMFHPLAAERIHRDLPDVKLIVQLRDPVERAFSHHAFAVSAGWETETFERGLELEDSRLAGEVERILADPTYPSPAHGHYSYRIRGHYADQIERLEKVFARDRIHVIDSGDFFTDPEPVYDRLLEFLGLPKVGYPDFKHLNARSRPAPMPDSVRAQLVEHYRPHNERLIKRLGREPSWCR
ncbi:MAG: sulfotransferase [Streptosporangiaceae bacterium]